MPTAQKYAVLNSMRVVTYFESMTARLYMQNGYSRCVRGVYVVCYLVGENRGGEKRTRKRKRWRKM